MRLRTSEIIVPVPRNPTPLTQRVREWFCLECDYFEEAEHERT